MGVKISCLACDHIDYEVTSFSVAVAGEKQ